MELFYPNYYEKFHCIASACPDSCCKEWAVDVDPEAAQYYRNLPGLLGDRLRAVLEDTDDGTVMAIENGRCPMWRQDGLCRIQAELGHDALCQTCRTFPRLHHDYGTFTEQDLELSCPEAARLILSDPNPKILRETTPGEEAPDFDPEAMQILLRSRRQVLDLLLHPGFTPFQALAALLLYSHSVQDELDGGEETRPDPEALLQEAREYAATPDQDGFLQFFLNLELLTETWKERLLHPLNHPDISKIPALAAYLIRRYWLQSVSDLDLICRAKLIVSGCILVSLLGGNFTETAQLFSKEIENDPDNVEAILDGAYTAPALTDRNLFSLLFSSADPHRT